MKRILVETYLKKTAVQARKRNRESMNNELVYPCGKVEQSFKKIACDRSIGGNTESRNSWSQSTLNFISVQWKVLLLFLKIYQGLWKHGVLLSASSTSNLPCTQLHLLTALSFSLQRKISSVLKQQKQFYGDWRKEQLNKAACPMHVQGKNPYLQFPTP